MPSKPKNRKLLIGVTGGIGAGKSLACKYFEDLGCKVFYADDAAKELYRTNKILIKNLASEFGERVLENKAISINSLRELVFNNISNQKRVNKIVHPFVFDEFAKFVKSNTGIIIHEAALIFESGLNKKVDYVINISSNQKNRIGRIRKRNNMPVSRIKSIMSMQLSEKERNEKSDFIVKNDGTISELKKEIKLMHLILKSF